MQRVRFLPGAPLGQDEGNPPFAKAYTLPTENKYANKKNKKKLLQEAIELNKIFETEKN